MRSTYLTILTVGAALTLHPWAGKAQAPIERRSPPAAQTLPNAPAPTAGEIEADNQWQELARRANRGPRTEIRVQAMGEPIRCDLDAVTPDELFCVEHRAVHSPLRDVLIPPAPYRVPRADVRNVRTGGRDGSTALGALIGAGVGVGLGSASAASRSSGGQLMGGLLFGLAGAAVGHFLPFRGHVVYQRP
ncbi:MAG TPA: hypothetical protein VGN16_09955 [Acidobacteriaceae bacterium]|jgi:hypothetical protein